MLKSLVFRSNKAVPTITLGPTIRKNLILRLNTMIIHINIFQVFLYNAFQETGNILSQMRLYDTTARSVDEVEPCSSRSTALYSSYTVDILLVLHLEPR